MTQATEPHPSLLKAYMPFLVAFALALAVRFALLVLVVPFDSVDDSYHHWVISYWTLKIGLAHGRMWDLYGQDYYWGPTPHLLEGFFLGILNTTSLLPYRIFNIILASLSAGFAGKIARNLVKRDAVAILAGVVFALSPLAVWETFAVTEPLANFLFLLGVYQLNRSLYRAGLFFALASTTVAAYWVVSAAFLVYYYLRQRVRTENLVLLFGWLSVMIPYSLILQLHTGIFYYPLYYQFLVGIGGAWIAGAQVAFSIQVLSIIGLIVLSLFGIRSLFRKRHYDLTIVAFGLFTAFHFAIFTFSAAPGAVGFLGRFFFTDWAFVAVLIASAMAIIAQRTRKSAKLLEFSVTALTSAILAGALIVLVFSGTFATGAYATRSVYDFNSQTAIRIQETAVVESLKFYEGGKIMVNHPTFAYFLVQQGVKPEAIISSQYAPTSSKIDLLRWLQAENVKMFIMTSNFRDDIITEKFPALKEGQSDLPFVLAGYADAFPVYKLLL